MASIEEALNNAEIQLQAIVRKTTLDPQYLKKKTHEIQQLFHLIFEVLNCVHKEDLLRKVKRKIDLVNPLKCLIHISRSNCMEAEKIQLTQLLSFFVWYTLTDITVQHYAVGAGILNQEINFGTERNYIAADKIVFDQLYIEYTLHKNHTTNNAIRHEDCFNFLIQLEGVISKIEKITAKLWHKLQLDSRVFDCLTDLLQLSLDENDKEICTLFLISDQTFLRKLRCLTSDHTIKISVLNQKCIWKLLNVIGGNLKPRYFFLFLHNQDLFSEVIQTDLSKLSFSHQVLGWNQFDGIKDSIKFILELLDHGTNFSYLNSTASTDNLVLSVGIIHHNISNRQDLYHCFNLCSSKISLLTSFSYLNYLISLNLMGTYEIQNISPAISNHFKQFVLPPLAKRQELSDDNDILMDEFGINTKYYDRSTNHHSLRLSLLVNLENISEIIENELISIQFICNCSSVSIDSKMIFELVDLILSSLITSLILVGLSEHSDYLTKCIKIQVYKSINRLLNVQFKTGENPLLWVCLINLANDVCYSDISQLEVFEQTFDYMVNANPAILHNGLVLSGLDFFKSTFHYGSTSTKDVEMFAKSNISKAQVAMSLTKFKGLYEKETLNSNGTELVSSETVYTENQNPSQLPTSGQRYVTNSARQQSVHVDQFGK